MIVNSLSGISNSSIRGDGRHLNVLRHCWPIIRCVEAGSMWRNRGLYHV